MTDSYEYLSKLNFMTWHDMTQHNTIQQKRPIKFHSYIYTHAFRRAHRTPKWMCNGHIRKKLLRSNECIIPCTWHRGYEVLNLWSCHSSQTLHTQRHTRAHGEGDTGKKRLPFVRHHMYKLKLDRFRRNGRDRAPSAHNVNKTIDSD